MPFAHKYSSRLCPLLAQQFLQICRICVQCHHWLIQCLEQIVTSFYHSVTYLISFVFPSHYVTTIVFYKVLQISIFFSNFELPLRIMRSLSPTCAIKTQYTGFSRKCNKGTNFLSSIGKENSKSSVSVLSKALNIESISKVAIADLTMGY